MLAIRLQRTGRKGHAMFRVIVQESHLTPTSGKVVFALGSYDPHAKVAKIDKEKAEFYLNNGAQPSPRVVALLEKEGVKLPDWVKKAPAKQSALRNPEKLRRNQPKEEPVIEDEPIEADATPAEAEAATEAEVAAAEESTEQSA